MTSFPLDKHAIINSQGNKIKVIGWSGRAYWDDVILEDGGEGKLLAENTRGGINQTKIYIDETATEKIINELRSKGSSVYNVPNTEQEVVFYIPDTVAPDELQFYVKAHKSPM